MAEWNKKPAYTELERIMLERATRKVGLTAEQFNAVMENIQYLKNLYGLYKVDIGTVTVIYGEPGTPFDVEIEHRQEKVGSEYEDFIDLTFTMAIAKMTATCETHHVEAGTPLSVEVNPSVLESKDGYNLHFNMKIPMGEIRDVECSESAETGTVNHTLYHETDRTFTSTGITKLNLTIPNTVFHGYYAGVNFPVGTTPPTLVFTNNSGLPLKLMKRGTKVDSYTFTTGNTVLLLVSCDGINVYCNLIEA